MRSLLFAASAALALAVPASSALAQEFTPPPVETYGELAAIEEAILSPSGTYTALLMTTRGDRVITILDARGAPVKQLAVGDAKVRGIEWVGEEAILLLRTETDRTVSRRGSRKIEFWRGNVIPLDDNAQVVSIFANQRYVANAILGFKGIRQVDGRWKGYFGGLRKGRKSGEKMRVLDRSPALYEVDLMTGEVDQIGYPPDYPTLRDWIVDASGKIAATLNINEQNGNWRIENADGKTIAKGNQPRGEVSLRGLAPDGSGIVYSRYDDEAETARFINVSQDGSAAEELWEDIQLSELVKDPRTGSIIGVLSTDEEYSLHSDAMQDRFQKVLDIFSRRKGIGFDITGFDAGLNTMVIATSGNYDSGTWYRVDTNTGARAILGLERPSIQGTAIGQVSEFEYEAQDGLEIRGILTLPPGKEAKNLPAIILPHGGPVARDELGFDWWAQAFASRGYAVLQPNFRGSTGRGAEFVNAGDGEWGGKMQTDKSDGLKALAEAGIVDASRACIVGASYGGYGALAGVTIENGVYRCAVSVNGVSDLKSLLDWRITGSRDIFRRAADRQFGKDTDLDAISPSKLGKKASAPVLLIHGRDDTVVPYAQSVLMEDALKDAGKSVKLVTLDGEDHYLSQPATRKRMLSEAIAFVEEHNPAN
uniref:alpha/beta hydrolase family protein n=1 Tax=uncultured Erythrobacter sp. TaxID=263913 RepID=UPI00262EA7CC|nr:S9 family peptidase [uncultured Erythrobacter sp.]